jgi:hypothetical protein
MTVIGETHSIRATGRGKGVRSKLRNLSGAASLAVTRVLNSIQNG